MIENEFRHEREANENRDSSGTRNRDDAGSAEVREFVEVLLARVESLEAEVSELNRRIGMNPQNSSVPPSSEHPHDENGQNRIHLEMSSKDSISMLHKIMNFPSFFRSSHIYRRTYGFRDGMRVALQVRRAHYVYPPGALVSIVIPGLRSPVFLRARTADVAVFRQIFGYRELDIEICETPTFIIDAGAHIGLSSIWLSHRFPGAYIVALEVEASNFSLLKKNTASYKKIIPINKALWWKRTVLEIEDPTVDNWEYRITQATSRGANSVEAVTVQDILLEYGRDRIDLLKMDIEGAELDIFTHHYQSWIDRVQVIFVELHDRFRLGCKDAMRKAIAGRHFTESMSGEYTILRLNKEME